MWSRHVVLKKSVTNICDHNPTQKLFKETAWSSRVNTLLPVTSGTVASLPSATLTADTTEMTGMTLPAALALTAALIGLGYSCELQEHLIVTNKL